jgi:flagellar hook protein FlgE
MSTVFSTAVSGINNAVARASQSANNIANASLTGKNLDRDLVNVKLARNDVAVNATVIKAEHKMQKALIDIKV